MGPQRLMGRGVLHRLQVCRWCWVIIISTFLSFHMIVTSEVVAAQLRSRHYCLLLSATWNGRVLSQDLITVSEKHSTTGDIYCKMYGSILIRSDIPARSTAYRCLRMFGLCAQLLSLGYQLLPIQFQLMKLNARWIKYKSKRYYTSMSRRPICSRLFSSNWNTLCSSSHSQTLSCDIS